MGATQVPGGFELLPWHRGVWGRLQQARASGRLPHAILLSGQRGLGKLRLATGFAQSLLCRQRVAPGWPCGQCRDCRLFVAGNHPDFRRVSPDAERQAREIRVDSIRDLANSSALTSETGGYKVIVLEPAERMNTSAANSLLKTLEEPAQATLLILVSALSGKLPATIRSRCQRFSLAAPPESEASAWLAPRIGEQDPLLLLHLASGAPLAAGELARPELLAQRETAIAGFLAVASGRQDPVRLAESWLKLEPGLLLNWLSGWLADLVRLNSGHPSPWLANLDRATDLRAAAERIESGALHRLLQQTLELVGRLDTTLNRQLTLERLLIQWAAMVRPERDAYDRTH